MSTEKLAKSAWIESSGDLPPKVHKGFVHYVRHVLPRDSRVMRHYRLEPKQYRAFLISLLPLAREIEKLNPSIEVHGPNTEYPWSNNEAILAPVDFAFPEITVRNGPKLLKLVRLLEFRFGFTH